MSYAVNNVASQDAYQYLACPHSIRVSIQVFNNPILIGFGKGTSGRQGSEVYSTDEYLAPTSMIDGRECDAIRFKSATPGVSAQVTIVATPGHEVPRGHPLGSGFTPNYLTIDPVTGKVSANFSGHVSAHGLDLEAPTAATPPEDDKVRWIRTVDGAVVAEAVGFRDLLSRNFAKLLARTPGGVIDSRVSLTARDETALQETWLQVRRDRSSGVSAVVAHTDEFGDTNLIDHLGRSDYRMRAEQVGWSPAGAVSENFSRSVPTGNISPLVSGTLYLVGGHVLPAGVPISAVNFLSGGAGATPVNSWACLVASDLTVLAKSANIAGVAWAANAKRSFALSYTSPTYQRVYVGIITSGGQPNLAGTTHAQIALDTEPPIFAGSSTAGLTTPASLGTSVAAPTPGLVVAHCWLT